MLGLALVLALTQTPQHRLFLQPNLPRSSLAFFEFAPQSGTGMGAACACTTPTGAHGEALSFARASSATCLKGNTTSGIANGDMVTCTNNQPRVMPGGDGTGGLGLLVESASTNLAIRSQEIDNAAWTKSAGGGSAAPTVTADFAVAPDGTTTAERVQYASCVNLDDASLIYQIGLGSTATYTGSAFCKGTSADQTISVCLFGSGGGSACSQVVCPAAGWKLISKTAAITTNGGPVFGCNHSSAYAGNASTGSADVLLWGGQFELSGYATSYIATAGASATRATEATPTFTLATGIGPNFSMAATFLVPSSSVPADNILGLGTAGAGNNAVLFRNSDTQAGYEIGVTLTTPAVSAMGSTPHRTSLSDNAGTRAAFFDGASVSAPAASLSGAQTLVSIGAFGATPLNGVVKRACLDPQSERCR